LFFKTYTFLQIQVLGLVIGLENLRPRRHSRHINTTIYD